MQSLPFVFLCFLALAIAAVSPLPIVRRSVELVAPPIRTDADAYRFLVEAGYDQLNNTDGPASIRSFETLIERFQSAYHLPVTGRLDQPTSKLMNTPHCSMTDTLTASTYREKLWPTNRTLTWKLIHDHGFYDTTKTRQHVQEAFDDWAKHTPLTFREVAANESADFNLAFVYGEHGDGFPLADGRGGNLAHAFLPWQSKPGDIHFDSTEQWTHEYSGVGHNLRLVAAHEIGHSLGLEHVFEEDSIMYKFYNLHKPHALLPARDQNNIQQLYGRKSETVKTARVVPTAETTRTTTRTTRTTTPTTTVSTSTAFVTHLPNGDIYSGALKNGKRHGPGTCDYVGGNSYVGNWIDDLRIGKGTYTWSNGDRYLGDWTNDMMEGRGTKIWFSGEKYEGQFKNNTMHGKGTLTWPDKTTYAGDWVDGTMHGNGTKTWPDGATYDGQFQDDKMHGQGKYKGPEGGTYFGDWANDQMHGYGIKKWPNGKRFAGQFRNGKIYEPRRFRWVRPHN